jgi:predicted RNase H-like HicB family nuclease
VLQVQAHWDANAGVWWAESDDLPGLATEAPTFPELIVHIKSLAQTIIQENLGRRADGLSVRVAGDASEGGAKMSSSRGGSPGRGERR